MFLTRWDPGVPLSLFRSLSSSLFSSFSSLLFLTLPFLLCLFHWSISAVALSSSLFSSFLLYCSLPFLFSSMSFSLIYICCSFRGGILSVVFPTVAICFWPAGNLECPCLFSDLILFPFLLLFFFIVPYPSFSSMSLSLIYICRSFRGGILSVVFPTVAICFWPAGNLECPCLFFRPYPLPFSPPFLLYCSLPFLFSSMSFSLIYICCSFRGGILSVVFPAVAICFRPAGSLECPCLFSDLILFPFLLLFFILFLTLPFLLCLFHWSISAVVSGEAFYLICCFPCCSLMFLTRREPGVPLSLFRPYPLPFSPPFLLYCSLPFLFFYVFFIDLYLL